MSLARFGIRVLGPLILIAVIPAGDVLAGKSPDWVQGEDRQYPKERYLTGVGSGPSRQAAEDGAYAALSRIFVAEIHQRTREWERYLQTDTGDQTVSSREIEMDQLTAVSTKKVLENVSIAETYLDERNQTHYALAVMDRRQAGSALRERMASLDLEVEELLKVARGTEHKLEKVRALHRAVKALLLRDAYNAELRIVNPMGMGSESLSRLAALQQELQGFLTRHFRITLEISGKDSERVRTAVLEGLNRQGLPVWASGGMEPGAGADVVIKGRVDFEPVAMPQGQFIRWIASFELADPSTGQIIGSLIRQGREGHLTLQEAEERALRAVQKQVVEDLSSKIASFILGEGEK